MSFKDTQERQAIIHGLLQHIDYVVSQKRSNDELYHLEVILQQTLEQFVDEDAWDEFYNALNNLLKQKRG